MPRSPRLLFPILLVAGGVTAAEPGTFRLWQLPAQTPTQIMSYVIQTSGGKLVVIDGGVAGDAAFLTGFLTSLGGTVEAWILTHDHSDHIGALGEILRTHTPLHIKVIWASMPERAWIERVGSKEEQRVDREFRQALAEADRNLANLALGQILDIDGVHIEVLGVKNPEITANPINNSSIVLRVSDERKSILFLADLGVEGGRKLLAGPYADRLRADYVQMAHHGQNGVAEAVYQHIQPSYCLWPTPKWLWDNDNGGGKGSGPWKTLEVRAWMDKLPIKAHYRMFDGLCKIE